jgi:hypothetical protein
VQSSELNLFSICNRPEVLDFAAIILIVMLSVGLPDPA